MCVITFMNHRATSPLGGTLHNLKSHRPEYFGDIALALFKRNNERRLGLRPPAASIIRELLMCVFLLCR